VGENDELSFVVGFGGLVWVSYSQVRCNRRVQTFMKALKQSQWKEFLTEQEGRRLQPASLDNGPYGSQMEVKEVLHIMLWNGQWMFEIRAAHLVLDYEGVCGMGLVDNAADFLHANGGDAGVVDSSFDLLSALHLDSPSSISPLSIMHLPHCLPSYRTRDQTPPIRILPRACRGQIASRAGPYPLAEQDQSQS